MYDFRYLRILFSAITIATFLACPVQADPTEPILLSLTSNTTNGTYGIGSAISILATYDERLQAGSTIVVRLTTSTDVTLSDVLSDMLPTHAGSLEDGAGGASLNSPYDIFIVGNYAYIASNGGDALEIVDITNPANPTHKGSIAHGAPPYLDDAAGVYVQGNYAYVVSEASDSLEVVNSADPANPVHAGSIVDGDGGALLDGPQDIAIQGNYAYITAYWDNTLQVINITDPANPAQEGNITDGGGGAPYLNGPRGVTIQGNYAYVASSVSDALEIVNITYPANPTHEGSITDGGGSAPYLNGAYAVNVSGNYAYIVCSVSNSLEIVDISNPANPSHVGSIVDGEGGALLSGARGIFVSGDYAYITSFSDNALEIVNVTDRAHPTHEASIAHGGGGALLDGARSIFLSGDYAFVGSSSSNALEVVNTIGGTIGGTYTVAAGEETSLLTVQSITSQNAVDTDSNTNSSTLLPAINIADGSAIVIDGVPPVITSTAPTKTSNSAITDTTIRVTDNLGINAAAVLVNSSTTAGYSGFAATQTSATQVDCTISLASSGDLIINATDTTGNTNYTVETGYTITYPPTVTSITPATGSNNGIVTITNLTGTHFGTGAAVRLMKAGETNITAGNVIVGSSTRINCTFDVTYVATGAWTVVVINPDRQEGALTDGFTVVYTAPADTGGGGGGSSISMGAAQNIPAGSQADFSFTTSRVSKVSITAGDDGIDDVILTTEKVGGLPRNVDAPGTEILEYIKITPYRTTDEAIAGASIDFYISYSDLSARGWSAGDIIMLRWHDGAWQQLETHRVWEDAAGNYYRATTPGFSYFAIGYGEGQTIDETGQEEATAEPTATPSLTATPTAAETPTAAPQPTASPAGLATVIAALGIGAFGRACFRRR